MSAYKVNTLMGLGYVKLEQTKAEEQENNLNSLTTFKCKTAVLKQLAQC